MKPLHGTGKRNPFAPLIAIVGTALLCGSVYEWHRKGENASLRLTLFTVAVECALIAAWWLAWRSEMAARRAGVILGIVQLVVSMAAFFLAAWPLR